MSIADWAWVAGFVDGEGSIGIHRAADPRIGRHSYRAALQIGNTNRDALVRVAEIMGVTNAITQLAPQTERHATQWHFQVRERSHLWRILPQIEPYLVIKRLQAQLTLFFVASRLTHRGRGRYAPFTPQELRCYEVLREANRRGPRRIAA